MKIKLLGLHPAVDQPHSHLADLSYPCDVEWSPVAMPLYPRSQFEENFVDIGDRRFSVAWFRTDNDQLNAWCDAYWVLFGAKQGQ